MAAGTPLKWIQEQGGWASSQMLHDVYGHFVPRDMGGYARELVLLADPGGPREVASS